MYLVKLGEFLMSKMIEHLENIGTVSSAPIGFGTNKPVEKFPQLTLAALVDIKSLKKNIADDFDSIIVKIQGNTKTELKTAKSTLKNQIWGIWTNNISNASLESLEKEGCDFFTISHFSEPVDILAREDIGKLIVVPIDMPEELVHSINEIPIDAIIISGLEDIVSLTINDLMRIRSMRDLLSKPTILLRVSPLNRNEIKVIRDIGIQGILLDILSVKPKEIKSMKDDIQQLPPFKNKKDPSRAILPHISTHYEQAYEDDEDDEDDIE
jgi:hypothetical protein